MPRTAVITSWWIDLNPARRIDARYWIHVAEALTEAGIDPATATREQVRAAIEATEQKIRAAQDAVTQKYREAQRLQQEARDLSRTVDALPTPTHKHRNF